MTPASQQIAKGSRLASVITAGGVLLVLATIGYASTRLERLRREAGILEGRKAMLVAENKALEADIAVKRAQLTELTPLALTGLGHKDPSTAEATTLAESLDARKTAERLAASGAERRSMIVLRYYPKDFERDINEGVVLPQLAAYGFILEEGASRLAAVPTNAVWCGAEVHPDDVRLVALTLMAAGVELMAVQQFRNPTGPKRRTIEVGANATLAGARTLSVRDIVTAATFQRDPSGAS